MSGADDLFADLAPGRSTAPPPGADALFSDLKPSEPRRNLFARANDTVIETANAAAGLAKAGSDLIAPGNVVSRGLDRFIESGKEAQSDWKKDADARLARNLADADGEFDKAGIYLRHAVIEDPLSTIGQLAGNLGPFAALGKALQGANAATRAATTMGVAGGVSAGEVRGDIHERLTGTPDAQLQEASAEYAALRRTLPEAEAKERIASSFSRHAPEILATGAFGALGGRYGLEGIAARVAPARSRIANAVIGVLDESSQGAVEQLASNFGVRRTLPEQALGEDVALNAAAEGILGLGGGLVGRGHTRTPELPGEDFNVDAARTPADLGINPADGPVSRAAATAISTAPTEPVSVGPIPDTPPATTSPADSPVADFGEFAAAVQGQVGRPIEDAQRFAAMLRTQGVEPVIVPSTDGRRFAVAQAEALTPEQRNAVARFQPQEPPRQQRFMPFTQTGAARVAKAWAERDGAEHVVVPHPTAQGRFAVMRADAAPADAQPVQRFAPTGQTPLPLDHGELNIPGRTNNIDAELDRFGRQQAGVRKATTKAEAAQRRADKAEAKTLHAQYAEQLVERHGERFGAKELRQELKRMATWEPRRFIDLVAKFRGETADAQTSPVEAPADRFAVTRPDGSVFGRYSQRADAEAALSRAGAGARVIDTQPSTTTPEADHADPYRNIETRPDATEAQREAGRDALRDLRRRILGRRVADLRTADGGSVSVLGSAMYEGFVANGANRLTGQRIETAADLAALAQVYRDPRFETLRVIFTNEGTVVGETGYTSRLPAAVAVPRLDEFNAEIRQNLKRFGADGFYVLHNHPSGRATPSAADLSLTARIAKSNPNTFKVHVVIDHNEYAEIWPGDDVRVKQAPELAATDFRSRPELAHQLLGVTVSQPKDVAMLGKALQVPGGHATIVATDSQSRVSLIVDLPTALLDPKRLGRLKIVTRRATRETGAGGHRFLILPEGAPAGDYAAMMNAGIFTDVVTADGFALSDNGVLPRNRFEMQDIPSMRVSDETTAYGDSAPPPPPRLTPAEWAAHALRNNRSWALGALTRDQLTDIWGDKMPGVRRFDEVVRKMDTVRQRVAERADALIERWRQLPATVADRMSDLMHRATLAEFDPDAHRGGMLNAEQAEMMRIWNSLPETAKAVYRDARESYRDTLASIRDGLATRAENAGTNGAKVAAQIRLEFDKYLSQGPYFPLARFGDLLLIADNAGGERIVEAFESSARREQRVRQLRASGWTVKTTAKTEYSAAVDGASNKFVGEVMEKIHALNIPAKEKSRLIDNLNQLAIATLPDASYRRHFRHRKGVPGFSADAMRAFASSMMHAGHHIARIRHAHELSFLIDEMRDDAGSARGDVDVTTQQQVINELGKRLDYMMNPTTHPVAAAAGQVGFVMSLGGSVAAGLVNMTQTPFVTYPWLGAKHGFPKAAAALTKASKDYFGGKWEKWSGFVITGNPKLTADEKNAIRRLEDLGLVTLTQAHDLAGTANTDSTVSKRAWAINRAMKIVGWTFHVPEVFNRQVSALAAYRLARQGGQDHDAAVESARQAIIRTHFDYSASNRARFMQGNFTRVITMFKQYSQQMTYLMWRNAYRALKDESPEVRREARRMLVGVAAMHFTAAGTLGLPLGLFGISPLLALLSMGMGDEDEPWDWETEYRKMLADTFGVEAGEAIAHGPARLLLNVDLASRVGLGDMWVRAPLKEAEGRDLVEAWMLTLLGPVAGYVGQLGTAAKAFDEGKFARGVEAMMPKFASAPLKAYRFADEGVRSWRGDDLGIDLTPAEIVGTALGFQPARLAEMYEGRAAVKGREQHLSDRRAEILNMWVAAGMAGDRQGQMEAVQAATRFSRKNPAFAIDARAFQNAARSKARNAAQIQDGIFLTRKREGLREEGRFANLQ